MEKQNELVVSEQTQIAKLNLFASKEAFELGQRMSQVFASSTLVPKQYQGNIGNCLIGLNIASRMGSDPLMVFQNLVIVHNVPTFEAKFAIACFNATGKYTAIKYKMTGEKGKDSWGCIAYAIEKSTGELCEGMEITIGMAKAEGWYNQNPKWKNIPELMLRYRAASWFIRTTDPGVMMGFQTREEAEDVYDDYEEMPTGTEAAEEAAQNANTEQIIVPATDVNAGAPPADGGDNAPTPQPEPKDEGKEPAPQPQGDGNAVKPVGAAPTPDLFK